MSYNVIVDPSGALLPDIDNIRYRSTNINFITEYDSIYQLRNSVGKVVADNFYPYVNPIAFQTPRPYFARDASNNVYVTKETSNNILKVGKIVDNNLVDLNFTIPGGTTLNPYTMSGLAIDSSGFLYVTTTSYISTAYPNNSSQIYKVNIAVPSPVVTIFNVSGISITNTALMGLDFDSNGNLYIADRKNSNIIKISMVDYSNGIGSIYIPYYLGLNSPLDIKFDQYDNAYIANTNNIIKVTPLQIVSVFASGLLYTTELSYNPTDSVLYTTNYGNSSGDLNNTYIGKVVNGKVENIKYVQFPYGVVVTTTGNIYYNSTSNYNNNFANVLNPDQTITELTPYSITSNYANTYTAYSNASEPYTSYTYNITPITSCVFDNSMNLYSSQYNNLQQFREIGVPLNPGGQIWKTSDVDPYNPELFYPLSPIACAFKVNDLYVINYTSNKLLFVNTSGVGQLVDISGAQLQFPRSMGYSIANSSLYIINDTGSICTLTFPTTTTATSSVFTITGLLGGAKPIYVTTYPSDPTSIYVACNGPNDNIYKINRNTGVATLYNTSGVSMVRTGPIAFDNVGNLYVGDSSSFRLYVISPTGVCSNVFILVSSGLTGANSSIRSLAYDGTYLYIANASFISVASIVTTTYVISSVYTFTGATMTYPSGMAYNSASGALYVANTADVNILKIVISTSVASIYNQYGVPLVNPTSIAFDTSANLYVSNSTNNNLVVITPSAYGRFVQISGQAINGPSAIVFDNSSKLYVANSLANSICKLSFSTIINAISTLFTFTGSDMMLSPAGLDFNDTFSNLYISNPGYNNILSVKISDTTSSVYNQYGTTITSPSGIYFSDSTGILYISDLDTNNIIQITNNTQASKFTIIAGTSSVGGTHQITINQPTGLTMDSSGNLYISNYGNQTDSIIKLTFDSSTNPVNLISGEARPSDSTMDLINKNTFISNNSLESTIYKLNVNNVLSIYATPSNSINSYMGANTRTITLNNATNIFYYIADFSNIYYEIYTLSSTLQLNTFTLTDTSGNPLQIRRYSEVCIRYRSPNLLYITDPFFARIIRATIDTSNPLTAGIGTPLAISGLPGSFRATRLAFDSTGNMYICSSADTFYGSPASGNTIYKININTLQAVAYVQLTGVSPSFGINGIAFDFEDYLYSVGRSPNPNSTSILYRSTPNGTSTQFVYSFASQNFISSMNYTPWEDSLLVTDKQTNDFYKIYLSYPFTNMKGKLGPYDDTLFIFNITNGENNFDVSFNVYTPYLVIDPSNIAPNVPTNTTFHFVTPNVVPEPTHSYMLQCNGRDISDVFCNNCTYNKEKFLAGTYPTGLVYSTDTNYLYVALQNDTISRVSSLGVVENQYFPPELGLVGPTSLVLDASYDMFILNAGSDFISYLTLRNNIISIDNSFNTDIYKPICLTYDADTDLLYLLSGAVPNTRITKINARTGVGVVLPIVFGTLYDPNGLTIDAYYGLFAPVNVTQPPNIKYLYVSNTDQNNIHSILRVNLTTTDLSGNLTYAVTTLVSGLTYKPFTMANQNDGFLYVANKNNNSLSKISITGLAPNIQPWAVNGISVPVDLGFDGSGNLYIANAGTNPRNSRISKIYTDDFFFTNVKLATGTCDNTEILDITTNTYVDIGYYASPNQYSFPIPVPFPIGS